MMKNKPVKIVVASRNPVKLEAVRQGFESMGFAEPDITGITVCSGVSDQPMTDEETLTGAKNRADIICKKFPDADFRIGIEGGIKPHGNHFEAFAWIYISWAEAHNRPEGYGQSRTTSFLLPPAVQKLIQEGYELGTANDMIFGQSNSKQKGGAVGLLTNNTVTRTQLYRQAVQLALIPYQNKNLY
jgi:inosine/xanthosine triphosphatase